MQIDIRSTVLTLSIIVGVTAVLLLIMGINQLRRSKNVPFYQKRHDRMLRGWRLVLIAGLLIPLTWVILNYSEPLVYNFISPSPTITLTPTITITPSITTTPTITLTPTITNTPSVTNTPSMPSAVENEFEGEITPNPEAVFSPIQFSQDIDDALQPNDPAVEFENPVGHLYGTFSYNNMVVGSQWSALWYRDGELVYYESLPWNAGSGGYGYTDWEPASDQWLPGNYEVQIFVGTLWNQSGYFTVIGEPPTPTITTSPTQTATATLRATQTVPATPTQTLWPTLTPTITDTPRITRTPSPTDTGN